MCTVLDSNGSLPVGGLTARSNSRRQKAVICGPVPEAGNGSREGAHQCSSASSQGVQGAVDMHKHQKGEQKWFPFQTTSSLPGFMRVPSSHGWRLSLTVPPIGSRASSLQKDTRNGDEWSSLSFPRDQRGRDRAEAHACHSEGQADLHAAAILRVQPS